MPLDPRKSAAAVYGLNASEGVDAGTFEEALLGAIPSRAVDPRRDPRPVAPVAQLVRRSTAPLSAGAGGAGSQVQKTAGPGALPSLPVWGAERPGLA